MKRKIYKEFRRNRKPKLFTARLLIFLIPLLLVLGLTGGLASYFLEPALPSRVVLSAGASDGAYEAFAARYADALTKEGVELKVVPSTGSVENFNRLKDEGSDFDVAFIQSGIGDAKGAPHLRTLASLYYEPLWVFYNGPSMDRIAQMK